MRTLIAMLLVIAVICGIGYWYYNDSQARMEQLRENNAQLESANKANAETINRMIEDQVKLQAANEQLNKDKLKAEERVSKLKGLFAKIELEKEALEDAAKTEEKINNGTKKVFERFRKLTAIE
jgi:hypothetical protein